MLISIYFYIHTSFECIHTYTHISYFQKGHIYHKHIYKKISFYEIHDIIKLKLESRGRKI